MLCSHACRSPELCGSVGSPSFAAISVDLTAVTQWLRHKSLFYSVTRGFNQSQHPQVAPANTVSNEPQVNVAGQPLPHQVASLSG